MADARYSLKNRFEPVSERRADKSGLFGMGIRVQGQSKLQTALNRIELGFKFLLLSCHILLITAGIPTKKKYPYAGVLVAIDIFYVGTVLLRRHFRDRKIEKQMLEEEMDAAGISEEARQSIRMSAFRAPTLSEILDTELGIDLLDDKYRLHPDRLEDLCAILPKKQNLRALILPGNQLGCLKEAHWRCLFQALPSSVTLLDLSNNQLGRNGAHGAHALAIAFPMGARHLETLKLGQNELGESSGAGLKALKPLLSQFTGLRSLGLDRNGLGSVLEEFAPELKLMTGLQLLDVRFNSLNELHAAQWRTLAESLPRSMYLLLQGNSLNREAIHSLWETMPSQIKLDFGMRDEVLKTVQSLSVGAVVETVSLRPNSADKVDWTGTLYHFGRLLQNVPHKPRMEVVQLVLGDSNPLGLNCIECLTKDVLKHFPLIQSLLMPKGNDEPISPIPIKQLRESSVKDPDFSGTQGAIRVLHGILSPEAVANAVGGQRTEFGAGFKSLSLRNTSMEAGCVNCLMELAGSLQGLMSLNIMGNPGLGDDISAEALAAALTGLTGLRLLNMGSIGLSQMSVPKMETLLRSVPDSVTALNLSDNNFGWYEGRSFTSLGAILAGRTQLFQLGLAGNELRGRCLEDGQGMGVHPSDYVTFFASLPRTVSTLDLSRNGFWEFEGAGIRAIAPALKQSGLKTLHFASMFLEPDMEALLAESLPEGCRVERSECPIFR